MQSRQQSLKLQPLTTAQQQQFNDGVKLILDRWYVLNLAVEMRWGKGEPSVKKEIMYDEILESFRTRKDLDELDLEDYFDEFFQVEFEMQVEDGSLSEVSRDLFKLHFECADNNFSRLDHLRSFQAFKINQETAMQEDDESEEDQDEDGDAMDVIEEEPSEIKQAKNQPVIDQDGFQLVQRKRR
eukprot:TRINITY_DN24312_c0_g1_i1.p1 TRINITY_DN24312_c0_g1~~TRINITY_DN24312_c0_g1_i1.p1  ORF type:complete len:184 (-),score=34.54 TRINITY_DN24312_c0_g1_i1:346-897(-)